LTTTKRPPLAFSIDERRKRAQRDAADLIKLCGSLNKAAKSINMNKGRLSCIRRGEWATIALNEIDMTMLAVGKAIKQHDLALNTETRLLAEKLQKQLSDVHETVGEFIKVAKKL
jgi:hypothetical protein